MAIKIFKPKNYTPPTNGESSEGADLKYSFRVLDDRVVPYSFKARTLPEHNYIYAEFNFDGYKILIYGRFYDVTSKIIETYELDLYEVGIDVLKGFATRTALLAFVEGLSKNIPRSKILNEFDLL